MDCEEHEVFSKHQGIFSAFKPHQMSIVLVIFKSGSAPPFLSVSSLHT